MARMRERPTVTESLRQAIRDTGETLYRVAKDSGVAYASLYRFMASQRDISCPNIDKLCRYLGMRLMKG
jgi:hypothetical protein